MKLSKPKYEESIRGVAVAKVGKKSVSFSMDDGTYTFGIEDLPEDFSVKNGKEYFVNIRGDESAINGIRPAKGTYIAKCTGVAKASFGDNEDDFLVIEKTGKFGAYWQIVLNIELVDGEYDGTVVPLYVPWATPDSKGKKKLRFVADDDGNMTVFGNAQKSKGIEQLFDLFECAGLADVEVPFPDTDDEQEILTVFDKVLRKTKKKFQIVLKDGYIKSLSELDALSDEEIDDAADEDDEPEPKKPAKKPVVEDDDEPVKKSTKKTVDDDEEDEPVKRPTKKRVFEDD